MNDKLNLAVKLACFVAMFVLMFGMFVADSANAGGGGGNNDAQQALYLQYLIQRGTGT